MSVSVGKKEDILNALAADHRPRQVRSWHLCDIFTGW